MNLKEMKWIRETLHYSIRKDKIANLIKINKIIIR